MSMRYDVSVLLQARTAWVARLDPLVSARLSFIPTSHPLTPDRLLIRQFIGGRHMLKKAYSRNFSGLGLCATFTQAPNILQFFPG
jgi:hypothetical protein